MALIIIPFFFFLLFGIYLILCDVVKMPSLANTRAALSITQREKKGTRQFQAITFRLSTKLSKYIKLDDYKRRKMITTLKNAGIALTPETYYAKVIINSVLKLCLAIPVSIIFPIMVPLFLAWAISSLFESLNEADKIMKKKREEIEDELPRFVATISQELNASRDVIAMFEGYKASAGKTFQKEIEMTIADMKSVSQEKALTRLESRIDSTMLSEVVRGLLGVIHGDNSVMHFAMLSHDFKQIEIQRLKKEAIKRPGKVKIFSFLMLGCFILMYFVPIAVQLFSSIKKMF
jgi:archaeal flagellar protein FlaJ